MEGVWALFFHVIRLLKLDWTENDVFFEKMKNLTFRSVVFCSFFPNRFHLKLLKFRKERLKRVRIEMHSNNQESYHCAEKKLSIVIDLVLKF